jgi:alkylation response protein AidB-like acyl-CoA dehydrogenase
MDFRPTPDQRVLAGAVRDVLAKHRSPGTPGEETPTPGTGGVDYGLWRDLAELGVFAVRVPESSGGLGLGHAESVHVFEELGRSLATGPYTATALAAAHLPGYANGHYRVGLTDLTVGEPFFLEFLDALDALLIVEIRDGAAHIQILRVEPIELRADAVPHPVDPCVPLHRLMQKPLRGDVVRDAETADSMLREGALLTAAYQTGIAAEMADRAVAYAKQRSQFGRIIGSFQAVKHICADMFARAELARAAVHSAAVHLDEDTDVPAAAFAVASAKILADEAAVTNARAAIQVHGGMGCTWEMGLHYFLKRAWALSQAYGTASEHEDMIAETL